MGETVLHAAGDFRQRAKPCCTLQETSANGRNRAAHCRELPPPGRELKR